MVSNGSYMGIKTLTLFGIKRKKEKLRFVVYFIMLDIRIYLVFLKQRGVGADKVHNP